MAFPTIPTVAAGRVLFQTNTAGGATKTFPSLSSLTKNSGDLLIAIAVEYDGNSTDAEFSAWGGSFTEFADRAGTATMAIGCAYKWSTGSETGTFTVTTADTSTNDSTMILLSIPGAHASTPPEASPMATSTGAPPAVAAAFDPTGWGTEDTLWIAVGGSGETATTGSYTGITAAPTNYSDYADGGITADVVGGMEAAVAFRQLNAASEAPGAWTGDTSNARGAALVIAVRPAAATTFNQSLDATASSSATITAAKNAVATLTATASSSATMTRSAEKVLSATASSTSSIARSVGKTISATSTATAAIVKSVGASLVASATSSASLAASKAIGATLTATATATAAITKSVGKTISAGATSSSSIARSVGKSLTATASSTATLVSQKARLVTMTATGTVTATITKSVATTLAASSSATASITRSVSKTLSASSTASASLAASKAFIRVLTATASASASMSRSVSTTLTATATSSASIAKSVAITLVATASSTASLIADAIIAGAVQVLGRFGLRIGGSSGGSVSTSDFDSDDPGGQVG